jgi:hypothetical protein
MEESKILTVGKLTAKKHKWKEGDEIGDKIVHIKENDSSILTKEEDGYYLWENGKPSGPFDSRKRALHSLIIEQYDSIHEMLKQKELPYFQYLDLAVKGTEKNPEELKSYLPWILRKKMHCLSMTDAFLAKKLEISEAELDSIFLGEKVPNMAQLMELAIVLSIDPKKIIKAALKTIGTIAEIKYLKEIKDIAGGLAAAYWPEP